MNAPQDLQALYASVLREHVNERGNAEMLRQAYEFGRTAATLGVSVLDMVQVHHKALLAVIAGAPDRDRKLRLAKAAEFFAESLSSFETQLCGYRETNAELVQANERLTAAMASVEKTNKELEYLAVTDPLTGVGNRRHFLAVAPSQVEQARRTRQHLAVLILDIDHFKQINDRYGHPAGDETLRRFAANVRSDLRDNDIFARMGGEEFAVLLLTDDIADAISVAERIRAHTASLVNEIGQHRFSYSVSIGVAFHDDEDGSVERLLTRADAALYEAKAGGRNQVCVLAGRVGYA